MFLLLSCKSMPMPPSSWRNVGYSTARLSFMLDLAPIVQRRPFSSIGVAKNLDRHLFTESYLINSCGLSSESAKAASKFAQFQDSAKPDKILSCLRSHGFTDAHILRVVRVQPIVLHLDAEKNVLPKFEFFHSIGISGADLANLLSRNPTLLACSLNNKIIPCYNFLKSQLAHNEEVVKSLKKSTRILLERLEKNICPNIAILKGVGVPDSYIQRLLMWASESLCLDTNKFNEKVKTIISMGFNPLRFVFFDAIRFWPTEKTWQLKADLYRSWGWSEDEFLTAFKKDPSFLSKSTKKVTSVLYFLVNKMGWHPSAVARVPYVLSYSLKKRIIPRCLVIRVLLSKGLIKEEIFLSSVLISPEKYYLDRFVFRYQEHAPQLLDVFQGKLDLLEIGLSFEEKLSTKLN